MAWGVWMRIRGGRMKSRICASRYLGLSLEAPIAACCAVCHWQIANRRVTNPQCWLTEYRTRSQSILDKAKHRQGGKLGAIFMPLHLLNLKLKINKRGCPIRSE
jgi:hypothetical protein